MLSRTLLPVFAVLLFAGVAQAAVIPGVRVDHVSSELGPSNPFNRLASMTVDGSGLDVNGPNTHADVPPDGTMWLSTTSNGVCCGGTKYSGAITNAADPIDNDPEITWDLGARYNLSTMRIWNYNESTAGLTTRGVRETNLLVSNDGITYTNLGVITLNQAPGNAVSDFSQVVNMNVSARFVKLDILNNHGDGNGFTGLSEVRFDGTLTGGNQTLITGVTATASSQLLGGFDRAASHVVDGSGFNAGTGEHTVTPDGFMWLSTGNGVAGGGADNDPQITFDLGAIKHVGQVQIWNYNEELAGFVPPLRARGVNDLTVLVSNDGVVFSTLGTTTLFAATGRATGDFHQTLDLDVNARFVRFARLTNHGGDNNFVGLSEVRFFELPTIPEPATATLGLMGLGGLLMRRRRAA